MKYTYADVFDDLSSVISVLYMIPCNIELYSLMGYLVPLVKVMTYRQFSVKPLTEPMLHIAHLP